MLLSKLYRQMYANTGIATDSARVARSAKRARLMARAARRLFIAKPMPELAEPPFLATPPRVRAIPVQSDDVEESEPVSFQLSVVSSKGMLLKARS